MAIKILYTAMGRLERRQNGCGRSCPIIVLGRKDYMVDMQEMVVWACLNWRIVKREEIGPLYQKIAFDTAIAPNQTLEDCIDRLLLRGLLVSGSGETEYDALYDLLSIMYIIPATGSLFLRLLSFLKLTFINRMPFSAAGRLFVRDKRTPKEEQVIQLARQVLLSTAEIIKCVEKGIRRLPCEESIISALYDDQDTTSDNIAYMVKASTTSKSVITAVANLYLRQQIIFERL